MQRSTDSTFPRFVWCKSQESRDKLAEFGVIGEAPLMRQFDPAQFPDTPEEERLFDRQRVANIVDGNI